MKATITISMDAAFNEALGNGVELARILRKLASVVDNAILGPGEEEQIRDSNGNKVGSLRIE